MNDQQDHTMIKKVAIPKTLLLLNNFVANTTNYLNEFSESCEHKISNISVKLTQLEIMLSVLEAKLNSVPGLEAAEDENQHTTTPAPAPAPAPAPVSTPTSDASPPPPPPTEEGSSAPPPPPEIEEDAAPPPPLPAPSGVIASEHPKFKAYFKMQRLGVPTPHVEAKMSSVGLDPSVLCDPDAILPVDEEDADLD
jgi:hypothetical protein